MKEYIAQEEIVDNKDGTFCDGLDMMYCSDVHEKPLCDFKDCPVNKEELNNDK